MIGRLFCTVGMHKMKEVLDPAMTVLWENWCKGTIMKPTPCTFCVCVRCGYRYDCRTVGFSMKLPFKEPPEDE